jgi:hypothetical protein
MKTFFSLSAIALVIGAFSSCKKSDTPAPEPEKKTYLVKEVRSGGATLDYKYDTQNRFAGQVYRDAANHQEVFVTQFAPNNLPAEAINRDYTNSRASKYNYTYDAQNRCTRIELRDSAGPTTFNLRTTYNFTYTAAKVVRTVTNAATGTGPKVEYTIDANANYVKSEFYNAANTFIQETVFGSYDDKKNPYRASFEFVFLDIQPKNNYTTQNVRDVSTGSTTNYTATHTYNADGYAAQTLWNNGVSYTYTYEKR